GQPGRRAAREPAEQAEAFLRTPDPASEACVTGAPRYLQAVPSRQAVSDPAEQAVPLLEILERPLERPHRAGDVRGPERRSDPPSERTARSAGGIRPRRCWEFHHSFHGWNRPPISERTPEGPPDYRLILSYHSTTSPI